MTLSRIHQHFEAVASLQPALLLAGFSVLYALLNPRAIALENLIRTWPAQMIVALGAVACLSVPFGISMGHSARFILENFSKTLILAGLLLAAIRRGRDLFLLIWAFVAACGALAWLSIFVFDVSETPGGQGLRLNDLYTYDANDAGLVLTVGLPLAVLTLQASKTAGKIASLVVLLGIGTALARTGSRGAFVGLVAVGIALLFSWRGVSWLKRVGILAAVATTLSLAAPPGYWQQVKTLANPTEDYNWESINGRKAVALRGIGYMLDRPFFGLGIDNFGRAEGTISAKAKQSAPGAGIRWTAPHNSYIQVGSELGVPGLLLWCGLIFGGITAALRIRRRLPPSWVNGDREERFLYLCATYLPVAFIGFAATSAFLSFAYMDPVYMLAAYLAGLYVSLQAKERRDLRGVDPGPQ